MTEFAFKINGTDFSEVVNRYGYETDRVPVSAGQFTDLAGVDHNVVLRWRGTLAVTLNPMTAEESAALTAALMATPLQVTYHSFQLGHDVTEEMQITSMPRRFALKNGSGTRWLHEDVLSFQQN